MECVVLSTEALRSEKKTVPHVELKSVILSSVSHKKFLSLASTLENQLSLHFR